MTEKENISPNLNWITPDAYFSQNLRLSIAIAIFIGSILAVVTAFSMILVITWNPPFVELLMAGSVIPFVFGIEL